MKNLEALGKPQPSATLEATIQQIEDALSVIESASNCSDGVRRNLRHSLRGCCNTMEEMMENRDTKDQGRDWNAVIQILQHPSCPPGRLYEMAQLIERKTLPGLDNEALVWPFGTELARDMADMVDFEWALLYAATSQSLEEFQLDVLKTMAEATIRFENIMERMRLPSCIIS